MWALFTLASQRTARHKLPRQPEGSDPSRLYLYGQGCVEVPSNNPKADHDQAHIGGSAPAVSMPQVLACWLTEVSSIQLSESL